jgi:hypothetical protein
MRTRTLVMNGDTRASYDIINGGQRSLPEVPDKVIPPQSIVTQSYAVSARHRK